MWWSLEDIIHPKVLAKEGRRTIIIQKAINTTNTVMMFTKRLQKQFNCGSKSTKIINSICAQKHLALRNKFSAIQQQWLTCLARKVFAKSWGEEIETRQPAFRSEIFSASSNGQPPPNEGSIHRVQCSSSTRVDRFSFIEGNSISTRNLL